jgi:broad specificity phosphatase PhoE
MKEVLKSAEGLVGVVSHGGVCHCIGKEILGTEIKLPKTEYRVLEGNSIEDLKLVQ